METKYNAGYQPRPISVLIVPCGMETYVENVLARGFHGINCTLRNGNK